MCTYIYIYIYIYIYVCAGFQPEEGLDFSCPMSRARLEELVRSRLQLVAPLLEQVLGATGSTGGTSIILYIYIH